MKKMADITGTYFLYNDDSYPVETYEALVNQTSGRKKIYEVIRIEGGVPLFLEDYLNRMENSFRLNQSKNFWNREKIIETIKKLIAVNNHPDGPVKLIFGCEAPPFLVAHLMKPHLPAPEEYVTGVKTILLHATRINPNAKVWNTDLREKSVEELEKTGAYEAILVNTQEYITEGSRSNIFFIRGTKVFTTPDELILPGITRQKVLKIFREANIDVSFRAIRPHEIGDYDSAFLTGTTRKVVPVRWIGIHELSVDNNPLRFVAEKFDEFVLDYIRRNSPF